jgi:hypothetical protein
VAMALPQVAGNGYEPLHALCYVSRWPIGERRPEAPPIYGRPSLDGARLRSRAGCCGGWATHRAAKRTSIGNQCPVREECETTGASPSYSSTRRRAWHWDAQRSR